MDEVDVDDEGIAETLMDDNAIANVSRPGTSLKRPDMGEGPSQGIRCIAFVFFERLHIFSAVFYHQAMDLLF